MSSSRIKLLPDHVANQIAAGEVVQRPASVVKELMENALDAKADEIKLIVKDGGKTLIQVVDNGIGMNEIDARMSFERHATSKISTAEDLFLIKTKGFRGEALASIAAVAHVDLKTKTENAELGTNLQIQGSKIVLQEPIVTQKGTSLSVKNLFYNIPARRKFLKSIQVEMRHITDEFIRLSLAHPSISFSLIHNGTIVYQLTKANQLQRITNVFNLKLKEKLVPINEETDYIKIIGYIGKPEFAKQRRTNQYFFVNKRFIKSSYLHHALYSAYEGLIKEKTYPSYFVFFEIDPNHIDVNIHPTKTEIKFDDEKTVYSILKVAAKHSLGQFNLSPSMDFDSKPELEIPYNYTKKTPSIPNINVDPDFNPFNEDMFATKNKFSPKYYQNKLKHWETLQNDMNELSKTIDSDNSIENDNVFFTLESAINLNAIQLLNKYLVVQKDNKLVIIHQNRAHQLVLFHKLLTQLIKGKINAQQLIFPVELQFQPNEVALLKSKKDYIEKLGFEVNFDLDTVQINAVPLEQRAIDVTAIFQTILSKISLDLPLNNTMFEKELAKIIAEKSAVKSGKQLNQDEVNAIVNELFKLENPIYAPNGKKVLITLDEQEIFRQLD